MLLITTVYVYIYIITICSLRFPFKQDRIPLKKAFNNDNFGLFSADNGRFGVSNKQGKNAILGSTRPRDRMGPV